MRWIVVVAASLVASQAVCAPTATLGDIEVRIFYKETGHLSENVLSQKREFVFHNTIIGEGDAVESADDLMVSIIISTGKFGKPEENQTFIETPVDIVAKDRSGKILGRRHYNSVLTSFGGTEHKVMWLNDVTCAGEVTITATFAGQSKSAKLVMGCGE